MLSLFDGEGAVASPADVAASAPPATMPMCRLHPLVPARARCAECFEPICLTCQFVFPVDQPYCPVCATAPRTALEKGRKRVAAWSTALAGWNTFGLLLLILAGAVAPKALHDNTFALGLLLMVLFVMPTVVGVSLAWSIRNPPAMRPFAIALAWWWNVVILSIWVLMMIVGQLKKL